MLNNKTVNIFRSKGPVEILPLPLPENTNFDAFNLQFPAISVMHLYIFIGLLIIGYL